VTLATWPPPSPLGGPFLPATVAAFASGPGHAGRPSRCDSLPGTAPAGQDGSFADGIRSARTQRVAPMVSARRWARWCAAPLRQKLRRGATLCARDVRHSHASRGTCLRLPQRAHRDQNIRPPDARPAGGDGVCLSAWLVSPRARAYGEDEMFYVLAGELREGARVAADLTRVPALCRG
jgi:hypothetical protein